MTSILDFDHDAWNRHMYFQYTYTAVIGWWLGGDGIVYVIQSNDHLPPLQALAIPSCLLQSEGSGYSDVGIAAEMFYRQIGLTQ